MSRPDKWEKSRTHGQHLKDDEIALLRNCYKQGYRASYAASQLKCSTRTAQVYYNRFRNETP